ncbi:PAS domain-containing sensor histidine kinase [uncultured Cyclobacterium sp.]|uniref:PAS domain-containing sensor histidine kinase n=1 Tax=uncultured Cyclobacterium sp. TaxID=453820 RepID=UPI0030ED4079
MDNPDLDFNVFFNVCPQLLCIVGYDGYFKKVNPSFQKVLGYTEEELKEKPIDFFVHPKDRATTHKIRENLKKGKPLNNFENRYVSKSGETLWLSWTSKLVPEKQLIFGVAKLVNPKKELEAKRNELIRELTITNEKLKQLTITISHDLRSPVNNLLAVFNFFDNEKIQDEEISEMVDLLHKSTLGLKLRLDDFLSSLKKEELLVVKVTKISFQEVLDQSINGIKSLIKNSNAKIITDFSEAPEVHFNRNYLESIFLNLISNAIKYTRPDISPVIKIKSHQSSGITKLSVKDNGIGFDMEKVGRKIFGFDQKFNDSEESQGIGLYLVHKQITTLGGEIELISKPEKGSEFILSFKNLE